MQQFPWTWSKVHGSHRESFHWPQIRPYVCDIDFSSSVKILVPLHIAIGSETLASWFSEAVYIQYTHFKWSTGCSEKPGPKSKKNAHQSPFLGGSLPLLRHVKIVSFAYILFLWAPVLPQPGLARYFLCSLNLISTSTAVEEFDWFFWQNMLSHQNQSFQWEDFSGPGLNFWSQQ